MNVVTFNTFTPKAFAITPTDSVAAAAVKEEIAGLHAYWESAGSDTSKREIDESLPVLVRILAKCGAADKVFLVISHTGSTSVFGNIAAAKAEIAKRVKFLRSEGWAVDLCITGESFGAEKEGRVKSLEIKSRSVEH